MTLIEVATYINRIINSLSIASGLITVGLITIMTLANKNRMDRVSIRFTLAISVADTIRAAGILVYTELIGDTWYCPWIAYAMFCLTLLYLFLTVAIAINLHFVFLNGSIHYTMREWLCWIFSFGLAFLIPGIPLAFGRLGYDESTGSCDYVDGASEVTKIWVWCTFLIWIEGSCGYCLAVAIATIINLRNKSTILTRVASKTKPSQRADVVHNVCHVNSSIQTLIRRISLYCLIPIVTQFTHIIMRELEFYAIYDDDLSLANIVLTRSLIWNFKLSFNNKL